MRRRRSHRSGSGSPDDESRKKESSGSESNPAESSKRELRRKEPAKPFRISGQLVAVVVFALIVLAGPLLFGAADRLPRIGLLVLLGIGLIAQPPAIMPLSRWGNRLAVAFVGLLLFKEFAPAGWFGDTVWRTSLTRQYDLQLPFTHHPEPSRALDALLSFAVAVVWFLWVRRLAAERPYRVALAWTLFGAATIVAIVAFSTQSPGSSAIYGLRYTPGWSGFGPFPNRNHSADYFAMAAVLGCGCLTWAAVRKRWFIFCGGLILLGLVVVALLTTESRGGLIAFGVGFGVYVLLCLAKVRNRRALGAALAAAALLVTVSLVFGKQVFSRFQSHEAGEVSNDLRRGIWHDAAGMWRDAPMLGHGIGTFAGIFPLYETIKLENQYVLHPESSWLQWLIELGLIPVVLAAAAAVLFLGRHLGEIFGRQRSFFLHAGGLAALVVLLVHSIFDVPAHSWGTAGFALAALAIACPMRLGSQRLQEPRQAALVPLVIAAFWWIPIQWNKPAWSQLYLIRLIERDARAPAFVSLDELKTALRYFPLNPDLHQSVGLRELQIQGKANPTSWQRHFGIVARLRPGVWEFPLIQARTCQRVAPSLAMDFWEETVERGGIHRDELLRNAVQETARFPAAQEAWGRYVEAHPDLLLSYAQVVPEAMGRYYYGRWWKLRASSADLSPGELQALYTLAPRWGNLEDFEDWAKRHSAIGVHDGRAWAKCLRSWGEDDRAWQILSIKTPEPNFPSTPPTLPRERLENTWRASPANMVNAQQFAYVLEQSGEQLASDEIIVTVANEEHAPPWFLQKAAWILARSGHPGEAVDMLLQPR